MRLKLQNIADFLLTISAIAVATVVVLRYAGGDRRPSNSAVALHVGERLPEVPGVDLREAQRTLLLALRSTCGYCTASMAFYRQLASDRKLKRDLRLIAITGEDEATFSSYLQREGLVVDQIVAVKGGQFRAIPTPTVILADQSGRVAGIWLGKLSYEKEQEVIRASGVCETCLPRKES